MTAGVHIADVTYFVTAGNAMDTEPAQEVERFLLLEGIMKAI